ncbi:hypothetical protein DS901_03450 [Loktanella sp. D2R18]|uniref:hypothetical protein n=1 Tax=Rhodobacterales TaxID=204455 RepID=UPI000DEADA64|nr:MULTISPECIES: hypothetical protein [Rhodobacterales]RBW45291.1 hypothetical protein DS901_03450 [Loktanella sp. D2R18]
MLLLALGAAGLSGPVKQPAMTDDVIAYLAAGGSFSDLCGDTTDPSKASGGHCPACHLIAVAVLPAVVTGTPKILEDDYVRLTTVAQNVRNAQALDPARLSRAPPQA